MYFRIILGFHLLGVTAWVGGGLFFLLVLRPALKGRNAGNVQAAMGALFQEVSEIAMWAVIITGVLLTLERLQLASLKSSYIVVLSIKLALVAWMTLITLNLWDRVTRGRTSAASGADRHDGSLRRLLRFMGSANMQAALGITAVALAELLRVIYNRSLS